GFETVRQNGLAAKASGFELAGTQAQLVAEPDLGRDQCQGVAVDEARAKTRQLAFVGIRELAEQQSRDDTVQHRVAEKLQAFVVRSASTAVGERCVEIGRASWRERGEM